MKSRDNKKVVWDNVNSNFALTNRNIINKKSPQGTSKHTILMLGGIENYKISTNRAMRPRQRHGNPKQHSRYLVLTKKLMKL
jgi:hypothetical protein